MGQGLEIFATQLLAFLRKLITSQVILFRTVEATNAD